MMMSPWPALALALLASSVLAQNDVDFWNVERPQDMANIKSLDVMCGKTHMEVQISFDRPYNGIIFSKGAVDQYNCIYVKPQTGATAYSFNIMYNQCGTKPDMNGKFYENNIVIQYDKDLIEVWDEAKRLRCEWYNDYEKGITKPPIRVSDLEVVELNFRGDNVDCWMEIQHGKGPWANPVSGIVPLGTTLTMVIGINDKQGEFDMRVKSCSANAENSQPIQLSDEHGCVLRPKMISKFMKIAGADTRASVVTYAFFHAFKFPDSMAVNIKCKVEICRFGCPDHCQKPNSYQAREQEVSSSINTPQYRPGPRYEAQKAATAAKRIDTRDELSNEIPEAGPKIRRVTVESLPLPDRLVQQIPEEPEEPEQYQGPAAHLVKNLPPPPSPQAPPRYIPRPDDLPPRQPSLPPRQPNLPPRQPELPAREPDLPIRQTNLPLRQQDLRETDKKSANTATFLGFKLPQLRLPWGNSEVGGPRVESQVSQVPMGVTPPRRTASVPVSRTRNGEQPQVFPSGFNGNARPVQPIESIENSADSQFPYGPRGLKFDKRSLRERRDLSEEMGVNSGYQVISEVDLAFKPSFEDGMGVTVFQGRILPEEIVYGVCLPATGFSALFVLISLLTVISVLVSGFVCYHRQLQKVAEEGAPSPGGALPLQRDWGVATLLRMPKA